MAGVGRHRVDILNPIAWPEPFGMVMIEALAAGTPIVTTPCGAAPEIVDDGVTGFVRAETRSLVRALEQIGDIDRRECRLSAEERFSMSRMATDHIALYDALTARLDGRPVSTPVLETTAA